MDHAGQMASNLRQSGEMVQALRDDVYGRLDEKKQALEAQISAKVGACRW